MMKVALRALRLGRRCQQRQREHQEKQLDGVSGLALLHPDAMSVSWVKRIHGSLPAMALVSLLPTIR